MSRLDAPANIGCLHSLRVSNICEDTSTDLLVTAFAQYGKIGDVYRPTNLATRRPSKFMFVRYYSSEAADAAILGMDGKEYDNFEISVAHAIQEHHFTKDTGFITNMMLDKVKPSNIGFDSTMPDAHFLLKRQEAIRDVDVVFTIRLDDVAEDVTIEDLRRCFRPFGEISSVYYPVDLKTRMHKGFAFIRFLRQHEAECALRAMHNTNIGKGRNILISIVNGARYFSQDESH